MKQGLLAGKADALNNGATEYHVPFGAHSWSATELARCQGVSAPGTISKLRVELSGGPTNGSYTFTLRRGTGGGAMGDTALTCNIADAAVSGSDLVNTVAIVAGDELNIQCEPIDTPDATPNAQFSFVFIGTNANESNCFTGLSTSSVATYYGFLVGGMSGSYVSATEAATYVVIPTGGTLKNMYVQCATAPGAGKTTTFTVRKSAVADTQPPNMQNTSLAVTLVDAETSGNHQANPVTVAAGDVITICAATDGAASYASIGITFEATIDGESLVCGGSDNNLPDVDTEYIGLISTYLPTWLATEASRQQLSQGCVFKKLYVALSGSPGTDNNYAFTVRQNAASPGSGLVVTIADAATSGNDTSNDVTIAANDNVNLMVVPTSAPTVRDAYWGMVCYIAPPIEWELTETLELTDSIKSQGLSRLLTEVVELTDKAFKSFPVLCTETMNLVESKVVGIGRSLVETMGLNIPKRYEYYITGDDGVAGFYGTDWVTQTFTPSISHTITSVKLKVFRGGSPGILTVSIRATDGVGKPTGSDLCLGTTDGDTLTTNIAGEWRMIALWSGYDLVATTKYAIVIRAINGSDGNAVAVRVDTTTPTYAGGSHGFSLDSGDTWALAENYDWMFEEWHDPEVIAVTIGLTKTIANTIALTDKAISGIGSFVTDTLSLTGAVVRGLGKIPKDILKLTDAIIVAQTLSRLLTETMNLTDKAWSSFVQTFTDTLKLTEAAVTRALTKTPADIIKLTENVTTALVKTPLTEVLKLTGKAIKGGGPHVTDTISLVEAAVSRALTKTITNTISLTDTAVRAVKTVVAETLNLTGTLTSGVKRTLADTISLTSLASKAVGRTLTEVMSLVETVIRLVWRMRELRLYPSFKTHMDLDPEFKHHLELDPEFQGGD